MLNIKKFRDINFKKSFSYYLFTSAMCLLQLFVYLGDHNHQQFYDHAYKNGNKKGVDSCCPCKGNHHSQRFVCLLKGQLYTTIHTKTNKTHPNLQKFEIYHRAIFKVQTFSGFGMHYWRRQKFDFDLNQKKLGRKFKVQFLKKRFCIQIYVQ